MADGYISQIKTPDNKVYNFRDQHLKVYTGSCTTAAATAIKDVTTDGEFTLAKGAVIFVNFSVTNTAAVANLKLRINSSAEADAKPIKHQYNATESNLPGVGYIRANQTYAFYYDGTNWVMITDYNTNNNDTGYYIITNGFRQTVGTNKIPRRTLFARIANGNYETFTVTANTVATTKAKNTNGFLPEGKIYWNGSDTDYAAGVQAFSPYEQYHSIDYRYTFNITTTGIPANAQTYVKWTYADGLLYLADEWFATALPTTEDGFIYQRIGSNYYGSAEYRGSLLLNNPYYIYKNGNVQVWNPTHLSAITGADDLKAIEAISDTTGLLKKTAANTWTLDTNNYVTSSGITSVTIGATSPVQSSTSTAQTGSSASTTISLKDAYGDTKNPYGAKAKNLVLAGPSSGNNAAPTFRALVVADIPNSILKWQTTTEESTALYDFGVYVNMNNANGSSMNGGNYFNILNMPYRKSSGNTKADWGWQLGNTTSNDGRLWYRTAGDNVWGEWQTIAHATQSTSDIGSTTQPVYMTAAGVITAGTALKDLAYISKGSGTTKFLREDGTWQTALTSHQSLSGVVHIRNNDRSYTTNIGTYVGSAGKKYARIKLPDSVATKFGMYQIEVSIRYNWTQSRGGKILINLYHNATSPYNWAAFHAEAFGDFTDTLHVYGSDGKYIYIQPTSEATTYTNISINKILVGDAAGSQDISSISIDWVDELPTTYQTAQVYRGVLEKGTSTSWNISISGNAATVNNLTVKTAVPANAVFTDTNKYHKTGSWNGLTYTATAVNNADELKFTIPNKIQTNWELNATSGNSPALLFTRNSTLTDWKIFVTSGKLSFQSATDGSTWTERAYFKDNSGDLVATSFTGKGSDLTDLDASNISNGTLNLARLGNQNANVVLAGPSSGNAAAPTFRELVAADIPNLSWSKITSDKPTTLSGYGITDAKIASGTITLGSNTISPVTAINWDSTNKKLTRTINGTAADVVTAATLRTDLGLSNALHFIGITSTTLTDGSTTATLTAKSTGSLSKTTGFVDGDVVMDGDQLREYVWSGSAWRLLGITTSTAYTQPASTATNTWIAQVSQGTDGKITATTGSLNTSGTWSGTASKATTTANTTDSIYPVGVKSGATTTLLHDTSITMKGNAITAVTYNSTAASLTSETSTTANTAKYATLTLGNNANVNSTTAHSEGQIIIYSAATQAHTIKGTSTTTAYTHTLPNDTGLLVSLSGGTAKGSTTKPVYIPNTGIVTECSTYAGGTKVTFNGADKGASTASFYAPTAGGTAGHVLIGAGTTTAPAWYGGTVMSGSAAANWQTEFNGTTDATTSNAAAVTIAGGLGIAKSVIVGDTATITNDTRSPKFTLTVDDTDKAYLQYNTTDNSIDFIFA